MNSNLYLVVGYALRECSETKFIYSEFITGAIKAVCFQRDINLSDNEMQDAINLVERGYQQGIVPCRLIDGIWVDDSDIEIEIE